MQSYVESPVWDHMDFTIRMVALSRCVSVTDAETEPGDCTSSCVSICSLFVFQ